MSSAPTPDPSFHMFHALGGFLAISLLSSRPIQQTDAQDSFEHARHSCGTELSSETIARITEQLASEDPARDGASPSGQFVLPVTVHVVRRSSGSGGLGPAAVRNSLLRANQDFAPTGIQFCQVGETLFIDDDTFYDCVCGTEQAALRAVQRVEDTLNVYFVPSLSLDGSALCGLAIYPVYGNNAVIVRNSCAGLQSATFTHELGHFLDLLHTHETLFGRECADGTNCGTAGDLVCDTPADPNLRNRVNSNCVYVGPTGGNCPSDTGSLDPATDNHMSYARDSCRNRFTPGQILRMRRALVNQLPELARRSCPPEDFAPTAGLQRVSETADGAPAAVASSEPTLAPGGRFVAFASSAQEFLPDGVTGNGQPQLFVRDLRTGELEWVTHGLDGAPANAPCQSPRLSADGRYLAYYSGARNLVPGISNIGNNVFWHDRVTGETRLITPGLDGAGANYFAPAPLALSFDGQVIAFESRATNLLDAGTFPFSRIYVADLAAGTLELASVSSSGEGASNRSHDPALSGDGRVVAFSSSATNLHPQAPDGQTDVYVHHRGSAKTMLVSLGENGERYPGSARKPSLSLDGSRVAFVWAAQGNWPRDRTGVARGDIVVKDLDSGRVFLASASAQGQQTKYDSDLPALSADGRFVAFLSAASEFYEAPTTLSDVDVWLKDLARGDVQLMSPGGGGADSLGAATDVALDAQGRVVVFASLAANLVAGDDNGAQDLFAMHRTGGSAVSARRRR